MTTKYNSNASTRCSSRQPHYCRHFIVPAKRFAKMVMVSAYVVFIASQSAQGNPPNIDYSHNMRILKLPRDTKIGTLIYRLKGSDAEPQVLTFGVRGSTGRGLLDVRPAGFAEADVYLKSELKENEYKVIIFVTDGKETTEVESTILVTNGTAESTPFIALNYLLVVPEDTPTNETVGTIQALERESSSLPVTFELKGSDKFTIRYVFGPRGISKAVIILLQSVDYEKQNLYKLTVLAMNAWTNETVDTRNVATADLVVVVSDAQDTPPAFVDLPTVIPMADTLRLGEEVVTVKAEDGDYGTPRPVVYSISSTGGENFFTVNSTTGLIRLARSIDTIRDTVGASTPILLTVTATEVVLDDSDPVPPMETSATLVFVIVSTQNHPPRFLSDSLEGTIEENSPVMTAVQWIPPSVPRVTDQDQGPNGTMELYLDGGDAANIFDIIPSKGIKDIEFSMVVKTPSKLDYEALEKKYFDFRVVARDNGVRRSLTSSVDTRIYVKDTNDHIPMFSQQLYEVSIPENSPAGTTIVQVQATDEDSGEFGKIKYTSLNGPIANELSLDANTGVITLLSNSTLDRETVPEYTLTVEARDENGKGNKNIAQVVIHVADVNDNSPSFVQPRYDAVLKPDKSGFMQPLFVKATDADAPGPNSDISYEIVSGNYQDKFVIDPKSGELTLREPLTDDRGSQRVSDGILPAYKLGVRAHDQGFPHRSATVSVYVHSQDYLNRTVSFVLPVPVSDARRRREEIERGLSSFTGADVNLLSVTPHNTTDGVSVVQAWVAYPLTSSVDFRPLKYMIRDVYGKELQEGGGEEKEISKAELVARYEYDIVFWLLIVLVILILISLLILCCCWLCCRSKERRQSFAELKKKLLKDKGGTPIHTEREVHDSDRSRFLMKEAWSDTAPKKLLRRSVRPSSEPVDIGSSERIRDTAEPYYSVPHRPKRMMYSPPDRRRPPGTMHADYQDENLRRFAFHRPTANDFDGDISPPTGRYFVVKKDLRRRQAQSLIGDGIEDLEDQDMNRRQTEILYIRSPPREGGGVDSNPRDVADGSLPRSISQLALDGSNDPNRTGYRDFRQHPTTEEMHRYPNQIPRRNMAYPSEQSLYLPGNTVPYNSSMRGGRGVDQFGSESTQQLIQQKESYDSHLHDDYYSRHPNYSQPTQSELGTLTTTDQLGASDMSSNLQQDIRLFNQDGDGHLIMGPSSRRWGAQDSEQFQNFISNRRISPAINDPNQMRIQGGGGGPREYPPNIRIQVNDEAIGPEGLVMKDLPEQNQDQLVTANASPVLPVPNTQIPSTSLPHPVPIDPGIGTTGINAEMVGQDGKVHQMGPSNITAQMPTVSQQTTIADVQRSDITDENKSKAKQQINGRPEQIPEQLDGSRIAKTDHSTIPVPSPNNNNAAANTSQVSKSNINVSTDVHVINADNVSDHQLSLDILENEIKETFGLDINRDEDSDSGIGQGSLQLKKGNMLEKKSLFTIAYNGIQTRQLKSRDGDVASP